MATIKDRSGKAHILHVDDNQGDVLLVQLAFERAGIPVEIDVAGSAEQGLHLLGELGNGVALVRPDIILLDLNLPKMSGKDFLSIVKAAPELRRIPVLILTSSCAEGDVATCYDRHASGYLQKPFNPHEMRAMAEKIELYWFHLMQCPTVNGLPRPHPT